MSQSIDDTTPWADRLSLWAQVACQWECVARKPGNVSRTHDFADTHLHDFLTSAAAIGPVLGRAPCRPLGQTILEAVRATRTSVGSNTNLGLVLLLAPLAAVPRGEDTRTGVARLVAATTVEDARLVYQAIRLAAPAGLGTVAGEDLASEPAISLVECMRLAAGRDQVAALWAGGFAELFDLHLPTLGGGLQHTGCLEGAIVLLHLHLMALAPDSLIARKRGEAEAVEASRLAGLAARSGWPHRQAGWKALTDLDSFLRAQGHSRNPGTTADRVGATLFAAFLTGQLELPCIFPWWIGEGIWP